MPRKPRWAEDEWQPYDDYRAAEVNALEKEPDPFLADYTVETNLEYAPKGEVLVVTKGELFCHDDVIIEVEIYAQSRRVRRTGRLMKVFSVRYNAHIRGKHALLRYDDHGGGAEDWHVHRWDPTLGGLVIERITRAQLPTLEELIGEARDMIESFREGRYDAPPL